MDHTLLFQLIFGYICRVDHRLVSEKVVGLHPLLFVLREIFEKISACLTELLRQASRRSGLKDIVMSGGVSSSSFIRSSISDKLEEEDIIVYFDENENDLATDNAVGTALLGGKLLWA